MQAGPPEDTRNPRPGHVSTSTPDRDICSTVSVEPCERPTTSGFGVALAAVVGCGNRRAAMIVLMTNELRVVMTLAFYPRGGSAQVVRYLAGALEDRGLAMTVCCGSLGPPGSSSNASTFFAGLDVEALDFTEAVSWFEEGRDPMAAPVPMHPSFEDRPGVPDRVFASIGDDDYGHQVAVWRSALERVGPPNLYHAHHLTHVNDALLAFDDVPVVAHLHGTELKMLVEIGNDRADRWPHASAWRQRLVASAQRASRLIVISPSRFRPEALVSATTCRTYCPVAICVQRA